MRSSSHRSSMSNHRSSFSRSHHSSLSTHRSSFSRSHHSSISKHRSSLSSKRNSFGGISHNNMHKSLFKHHGISDAHAFAVGRATGININASARGAYGAALHRSRARRNARYTGSKGFNSIYSSGIKRKIKFSHNSNSKTKRYKLDPLKNNIDVNIPINNYSKYVGIFAIVFMIIFIIIIISMAISFSSKMNIFRF